MRFLFKLAMLLAFLIRFAAELLFGGLMFLFIVGFLAAGVTFVFALVWALFSATFLE